MWNGSLASRMRGGYWLLAEASSQYPPLIVSAEGASTQSTQRHLNPLFCLRLCLIALLLTCIALRICSSGGQQAGRPQGKRVVASPLRGLATTLFPCERGQAPRA